MGPCFSKPQYPAEMSTTATKPSPNMSGIDRGREVLTSLLQSNKSYIAGDGSPQSELSPPSRRQHLAENGQAPDACIIACADSRVAPEIIFNGGIGRLFVIRNAGNVTWGDSNLGSVEYAVAALKVPLVIVLGHSNCGAIGAAVNRCKGDHSLGGALGDHVEKIAAIIKECVGSPTEVKDSVLLNVRENVKNLREGDNPVASAYKSGDCEVVGGVYDLHTGEVAIIAP